MLNKPKKLTKHTNDLKKIPCLHHNVQNIQQSTIFDAETWNVLQNRNQKRHLQKRIQVKITVRS